jgi:glycosyltransferase involved in cell wall biosynthesis
MGARPLHIAWLGPAPSEGGGVPGVAAELLDGLTELGHEIDCYFPSAGQPLPPRLVGKPNLTVSWGTSEWSWDRWYSRSWITAYFSGIVLRGIASLRLRRKVAREHRRRAYDVVYQFSTIEGLAVPARLTRHVPLVLHPETHSAGELRWLIAERALGMRCGSAPRFAAIAALLSVRAALQRLRIRRARLLVCISGVFRDHLVRDYGFAREHTVVVPNPVRIDRFAAGEHAPGQPPTVLVLGRIASRKGIDDVVRVAQIISERRLAAHIRIVGGPSLWSDYRCLLEDLPGDTATYVGPVAADQVPAELAHSDVLLQASKYEPFALTVAEALAAGVPVVGISEVGAIERVDRSVAIQVAPSDPEAAVDAIAELLARLQAEPAQLRARARAECERLYAPERVCAEIADALTRLVSGPEPARPSTPVRPAGATARSGNG